MCFTKPKTPQPVAQAPAPASQGADALVLGVGNNPDDELLRNAGVLGRLALRVGRGSVTPGGSGGGDGSGGDSSGSGVGVGVGGVGGGGGGATGGSTPGADLGVGGGGGGSALRSGGSRVEKA